MILQPCGRPSGPPPPRSSRFISTARFARWTSCRSSRISTAWRSLKMPLKPTALRTADDEPAVWDAPRRSASIRARTSARWETAAQSARMTLNLRVGARQLRDLGRDQTGAHTVLGRNERLDGLQAAILRTKLQYLDDWIAARRALAADYRSYLDDRVELLSESSSSPCTYHLFPVKVSDREALGNELADRGVATGVHYPTSVPDHQSLMGRSLAPDPVPVARDWAARELSLPIFPGMSHQELEHVAVAVNLCIASQQPSSTRTDVLDMDRGRVLGNGAGSRHGLRGWVKQ